MSAAFALDFSGSPAPCGFPRCTLDAFHDGDHQFPAPRAIVERKYDQHCVVCGRAFTVYGAGGVRIFHTCGEQACVLNFSLHHAEPMPLMCNCPQRDYPHDVAIHALLRQEAYNPKLRYRWPWSLMLSRRVEPSTERRTA